MKKHWDLAVVALLIVFLIIHSIAIIHNVNIMFIDYTAPIVSISFLSSPYRDIKGNLYSLLYPPSALEKGAKPSGQGDGSVREASCPVYMPRGCEGGQTF